MTFSMLRSISTVAERISSVMTISAVRCSSLIAPLASIAEALPRRRPSRSIRNGRRLTAVVIR